MVKECIDPSDNPGNGSGWLLAPFCPVWCQSTVSAAPPAAWAKRSEPPGWWMCAAPAAVRGVAPGMGAVLLSRACFCRASPGVRSGWAPAAFLLV